MMKNEHSKNTKKDLQNKAFHLIETKGYDNVTIDQICNELGLTKGAFYHYFKSKSDILFKNYKNAEGDLMSYYNDRILLSAEQQLREIFDWYIIYFRSDEFQKFNAFVKTQLENYNKSYPITNTTQRMILRNILDKGIKNGSFNKDLNAVEVSNYIYIYISGLTYIWNADYGKLDFKLEINKFYNKFLLPMLKYNLKS
ncbi:MAG: TetR/AcrR family transcriptional regulator [Eubacteriales bacterium]